MAIRVARRSFVVVVVALGTACGGDDSSNVTSAPPAPSTWVFVDEAAPPGGDGTAAHPLRTLREALELDRVLEVVAVGRGRYPAPADWGFPPGLTIFGDAEGTTIIDVEAPSSRLVWRPSPDGPLALQDLELAVPLELDGGELELHRVRVSNVTAPALRLVDASTLVFDLAVEQVAADGGEPPVGDGVVVEGGSLTWTGGRVADVPDRALVLVGAHAELDALELTSRERAALTVTDGSVVAASELTVEDVSIAVYVNSATLTLERALVRNAGTAGLLASASSSSTVVDSTFVDCPNGHLAVLGPSAALTATGNTLRGATLASCLFASNTDGAVVVRDNLVERCAGTGISLIDVLDVTIDGNEVRNILPDPMFPELADGISALRSTANVAGNRIYDTPGYGIVVYQSTAVVEDNDLGPNESAAIAVVDPGLEPTTVRGNAISAPTGAGVLVLAAEALVTDNTISNARYDAEDGFGDGIAFGMGATVTAESNLITSCDRNGIVFLDGAAGRVAGNEATGNGGYGILELCTGAPNSVDVGDNELSGNALGPQSLCSP